MIRDTSARTQRRAAYVVAAGLALTIGTRVLVGPPAPVVTVSWDSASASTRRYLERRFSLTDAEDAGGGLRRYALRDTSEANRRALVTAPEIAGVAGLDGRTFELSSLLPRAAWRAGIVPAPEPMAAALEMLGLTCAIVGGLALLLPASIRASIRRRCAAALEWVQRGIPSATPQAAAAFRMVFGACVVLFVNHEPARLDHLGAFPLAQSQGLYGAVVAWLATHPGLVLALRPILLTTGVLFTAGIATRLTFACFTAALLLWACVFTLNISAHAIAALQIALIALLASRWGDAWSVDAVWRGWRGRPLNSEPAKVYGYSVWLPGFVFGVAFAAAAWSKLHEGPDWILNGTVKYHFVSDLEYAWVTWGLWLTRWQFVAVAMSAFAVIVEALLITASFSRHATYRAVLGFCAAGLLAGFALFQGIVWPAWWILLLSFLPWHLIGRSARTTEVRAPGRLSLAQLALILAVAGQQLFISASHVEARPMFSSYDMYSTTYATPEAYEAASNLVYRVVDASEGGAVDLPGCVVDDRVAAIARNAIAGNQEDLALLRRAIGRCVTGRPDVRRVALEGDREVFIWEESRFAWKRRLDVVGPFDADLIRD
jgi:hypothetical protein